jgi:hypothetical protein
MIIHLILALVRLATDKSPASAAKGSDVYHRSRPGEKVALLCPHCNAVGTATEIFMELRAPAGWVPQRTVYECDACKRFMDVSAFENDGNGILQVRSVECANCHAPNPAIAMVCRSCQKQIG